jgi:hypothetical protein
VTRKVNKVNKTVAVLFFQVLDSSLFYTSIFLHKMASSQRHCGKCRNYVAHELLLQKNSVIGDGRFFKSCAPCRAKSSAKNVEKNSQTNNEPPKNCSNCGNHVAKDLLKKGSVVGLDQFFSTCAPCRAKSSARKKVWREKNHQTNDDPPNKRKILVERDPDVQAKRLRTGSTFLRIY